MKHTRRWRRFTATATTGALAAGTLGVLPAAAAADTAPPSPIELRQSDEVQATTVTTTSDDRLQTAGVTSPSSPSSPDSPNPPDSPTSPDSPSSPDSPDSIDSVSSVSSADDAYGRLRDVPRTNVHVPNIERLADLGSTTGEGNGNYLPSRSVTRAQFASFLARALDLRPVGGQRFSDVPAGSTHAGAIDAVAEAGITTGVTSSTFEPEASLNREQLASLLTRAWSSSPRWPTASPTSRRGARTPAPSTLADAGITTGVTATTYEPRATLRRDQMASLLIRALDRR